jgi:hypothetical protein
MRKIREVLTLSAAGMSKRQIAASLGLSATAAGECIRRARRVDHTLPLPEGLTDETLELRRYPPAHARRPRIVGHGRVPCVESGIRERSRSTTGCFRPGDWSGERSGCLYLPIKAPSPRQNGCSNCLTDWMCDPLNLSLKIKLNTSRSQ